jgi:hypothetical protein
MAKRLQEEHGHEIHLPIVQLSMQDFRDFVREQYPENYIDVFTQIMTLAFPNYVNEILLLVAKLDQYNTWYTDNLLNLNDLDPLSKKGTIWQKRREIFADLADQIWQQEINTEEEKRQTVQQTIEALNQADNMTMQERLYILQTTLNEQYPDEQTNFTLNKGLVSDVYVQLESVQKDLASMTPEQRASALEKIREQLGFSPQDIAQLAKEDAKKEQNWQTGYHYMSDRDQLNQSYSGSILDEKLNQLRTQYFKKGASTIAAEEASGFYRYSRPRLYGKN